jgi:hypothetical protein
LFLWGKNGHKRDLAKVDPKRLLRRGADLLLQIVDFIVRQVPAGGIDWVGQKKEKKIVLSRLC